MALNNKKEEAERLRIQIEISEAIERQTKNLSSWQAAQKQLNKNAKLLKSLSADILALEEEATNASKERRGEIEKQVAELKKQHTQLKSINKEMSNLKTLLKAAGNSAVSAFKGLLPSLRDVISSVSSLDQKYRDVATSIGLSGAGLNSMYHSIHAIKDSAVDWGHTMGDAVAMIGSYNEQTGRAVILSEAAGTNMSMTATQIGVSAQEMGVLVGQMEAFGLGATQSTKMISNIQSMSENMGVNAGKVIKKFQDNLGMLNKLNFRGGMNAMAKMAAHSEKFKLSMESVASVSDKVFRPEGAIEAAAQLQVMGGAMSQLGDPFQLMYQARNAPEELAKSITKAARSSATFNEKTGEFEMSAHELDRLRESASALGMDYTELVQTAKQAAKLDYIGGMLGGMDPKDRDMLSGMVELSERGAEITFYDEKMGLQTKLLSELSENEKKNILDRAKSDEERARAAMGIEKQFTKLVESLKLITVNFLTPIMKELADSQILNDLGTGLVDFARTLRENMPSLKKVWETFTWFGKILFDSVVKLYGILGPGGTAAILLGGKLLFNIGKWVLNGMALRRGFMMGGSPISGSGGQGGVVSGSQALGQGKAAQASGMGSMMKSLGSAAQILAIGAALMMLAKSIEILTKAALIIKENDLGATMLGLAVGLGVFVTLMGVLGSSGVGEAAAIVLVGIGAGLLMIGGAVFLVSAGLSMLINSFTNMFSIISTDNIGPLMMLGPALMLASLGVMALAASLVVMGLALANPFGLLGLIGLSDAAKSLKEAFGGVNAEGITKAVDAVNSVNKDNVDALKSLSMWLAFTGKNIKIEFGEIHVDGEIGLRGQGGAKADSDLLNDPIFLRELKKVIAEHTYRDKKGGR
jgi:hypothetical protein